MGSSYNTEDYPYVLLNTIKKEVYARFSTLDKAHKGRLTHCINHPDDIVIVYNEQTKEFIDWRIEELKSLERMKNEY